MSSSALAWAFKTNTQPLQKVVLLALGDVADDYGRVRCSILDLANKANVSIELFNETAQSLYEQKLVYLPPQQSNNDDWFELQLRVNAKVEAKS